MYEGGWWLSMDKIKEMLKTGNSSPVEINFAFVIEGQTRLLPYDKLREVIKSKTILNRILRGCHLGLAPEHRMPRFCTFDLDPTKC